MTPQPGILAEGNAHAYFIIFKLKRKFELKSIVQAIQQVQPAAREVGNMDKKADLHCNVGIGPKLWARISPENKPKFLHPFRKLKAQDRLAPSTGGDFFFHIASARHDLNFELAMRIFHIYSGIATPIEEVHGFRYLDSRDLTGFIDGTENPKGKGRKKTAIIGSEDPFNAGGSYVAVQRYVHDLDKWHKIKEHEQEKIIGRTKYDSVQLSDHLKPSSAHISRVVIEEEGEELQILRQSYPYGSIKESGLFFVAYTKFPDTFELMLKRMMGVSGDRVHDKLMEFSHARTGANFFMPSSEKLNSL
ncbi:MAG: Dyp-type peroxidase [Nitrospiria bacterium]